MYNAIVLAGGTNQKMRMDGVPTQEALLEIDGKPMLLWVLDALLASKNVNRILVAGSVTALEPLDFPDRVQLVPGGGSIMDTLANGVQAMRSLDKVLVVTTDVPLLTPDAVDDFCLQCTHQTADLYYPVVTKSAMQKKFPGSERTYVKLQDGIFTGGNLLLVNPIIIPRCMEIARKVTENRKQPWRLVSLLGWGILLKFILGFLSVEVARRRLSEILKMQGCVVLSEYAEIAMDIDKAADLETARAYLQPKNKK